ncbi:MAG: discoidin domain-containing protein [Phycisphaerae bacterium]|nr:discoidin domain-containing protein [Phycisphaerae bacterium]
MCRKCLLVGMLFVLFVSGSLLGASPLEQSSGADGIVSVEAEHYDEIISNDPHTWLFVTEMSDGFVPPEGWSGDGAMQSQPTQLGGGAGLQGTDFTSTSTGLIFQVNFVKTGTHYLWILARGMDGNSDSCHATLDEEENTTAYRIDGYNNNYTWDRDMMDGAGVATLEVPSLGIHTLGIWMREDGLTVDKVVLTTNPDYTPTGQGPPESPRGASATASEPDPAGGAQDVVRDIVVSWEPGKYAAKHHVYFGDTFDDVNTATVPTAANLDVNAFEPGSLEFGKTYYWRVDEVNGTPDRTVFKGEIWSFEAEPYSLKIPGDAITVTASSYAKEDTGPEKTIDGSGLDVLDSRDATHSNLTEDMWLSAMPDPSPWLMYEFDQIQKLDQMLFWNSNHSSEVAVGWGVKAVDIETSVDGVAWTLLPEPRELAQGPGIFPSEAQVVDFGSIPAKYVRLTVLSSWGGILPQYGVAEVQFYALPTRPREPMPESGSVDVHPNTVLEWRAGREAGQHTLYISTDQSTVANGSAAPVTSATNSLDLASLDLQLGETYFWRVDEVNDTESPAIWAGPVWRFSTPSTLVVDDFESYGNLSPDRPFQTWLDGYGYSADEFFPVTYPGNGTGAGIGHDIWGPASPHFDGAIMETVNTAPGSTQSMPFYYSNTGGSASQTERAFADPQDWTVGAAKTLSIAFRGQAGNTGTLFAMINGSRVTYPQTPDSSLWHFFNIDLSSVNTNLQSVTKLVIGVEGSNASGMILIDDIKLHPDAGPVDPGSSGLPLIAWVSFHNDDTQPSAGASGAGFTEAPDKPYTDLLEANGYEVMRYITTNAPDPAVLNAVDLVIVSRSVASGGYQDAGATAWNSITTPMIIAGGYTTRSSRMGFTTGGTMVDTSGDITLTVNSPTHPIFAGIELINGTMANPFAGVVVYPTDGTTAARGISINNDPLNADGTLLASISSAGNGPAGGMVIGEWQAGATLIHTGGAGTDILAGHRLVFLTGAREADGISSETAGLYDLYEDGAALFLNAVEYMLP